MEQLDEKMLMEKYKLSEEEHNLIGLRIEDIFLSDKFPVVKPKAIIDIAPPASGKTGLNIFGRDQFVNDNVVIINSDEIKAFHPNGDNVARLYPQFYTKITDQESNTWTSSLFDRALREGYNVIFEGTGRNARILNTIRDKMPGYEVIVRGMAVNKLNCLMSILERYASQVETRGWGRLVTLDHFLETYEEMPKTIDAIEKSGIVHKVEVYRRGERPSSPVKIYGSDEIGRYENAKIATLSGRTDDLGVAISYFERNRDFFQKLLKDKKMSIGESKILAEILHIYEESIKEIQEQVLK